MSDILNKIKKLLTLANDAGATEGEAQAAMKRVAALAAKHNISDVEINRAIRADGTEGVRIKVDPGDIVEFTLHTAAKLNRWDGQLAMAVAEVTNTGVYIGTANWDQALKIYGLPQDVAVAQELFAYVRKAMAKSARGWMRCAKRDRPWMKSGCVEHRTYKDGFCAGLREAARDWVAPEKAEVDLGGTTALVLTSDIQEAKKAALAVKTQSLRLRKSRTRRVATSGMSDYGQGQSDGRRTDIGTGRLN